MQQRLPTGEDDLAEADALCLTEQVRHAAGRQLDTLIRAGAGITMRAAQLTGEGEMKIEIIQAQRLRGQRFLQVVEGCLGGVTVTANAPVDQAVRDRRNVRPSGQLHRGNDAPRVPGNLAGVGAGPDDLDQWASLQQQVSALAIRTIGNRRDVLFGSHFPDQPVPELREDLLIGRAVGILR